MFYIPNEILKDCGVRRFKEKQRIENNCVKIMNKIRSKRMNIRIIRRRLCSGAFNSLHTKNEMGNNGECEN